MPADPASGPSTAGPAADLHAPGAAAPSVPSVRSRAASLAPIAILLLAGLAFRLLLAFVVFPRSGLKGDTDLFAQWAHVLVDPGPGGAYAESDTLNYPPGYLWILWAYSNAASFVAGILGTHPAVLTASYVKLPAILADVAIGAIAWRAIGRWTGSARAALVVAAAWLFLPVSWYDSALWGQVDAIGVLAGGLALIWLIDRKPELAAAAATFAVLAKPQFAVFLGIVGIVLLRRHLRRPSPAVAGTSADAGRRDGPMRLATSAAAALAVLIVVILPFDLGSRTGILAGVPVLETLAGVPVVREVLGLLCVIGGTAAQYPNLSVNAYNPWALVGDPALIGSAGVPGPWQPDSLPILGVPAHLVGLALYLAVTAGSVLLLWRRPDRDGILLAATILLVAFFVLPTRVHERYLFMGAGVGILLLPFLRGWWGWVALSQAILVVNMHAILTLAQPWTGTPALKALPFGDLSRDPGVATALAIACIPLLAWPVVEGVRCARRRADDGEPVAVTAPAGAGGG